ncbi:hypothetical protein IPG41_00210 [Candidatus Peregrinibacteria bacterium]|nr:MAG: hypothetical protein IPG41_00210 [Candidatus Peregrinibacteria bacterium]
MNTIPILSIVLELVIAILALFIAVRGRFYMMGLALTFGIYVYYDLARLYEWPVSESVLSVVFLVATLAALISVIGIFRGSSKGY